MTPETRIILEKNHYVVLSTVCEDGSPWGTPVHFAFDEQNIYWFSADSTVHSQNVMRTGKVFLIIYNSQQNPEALDERGAVYVATTARALEGDEELAARDIYADRFSTDRKLGEGAHMYAAPIGILNTAKTKGQLIYYGAAA